MGILDSDTVIVDAILTKLGRNKLRQGQPLGITQYSFGDTGVDYTLYNPDHSLGSSYYGEAITDLPQLEAVPDDSNLMKYTLMTMDRNTIFLPKITSINETYTLENQNSKQKISPNTENSSDTSYHFVFNNISGLNITGGQKKTIQGTSRTFLSRADIPTAAIFMGKELTVTAAPTDETKEFMVQIIGAQSGAVKYINIVVNNNIRISPTV